MRSTPRTRACRFSAASPASPPSISRSASWNESTIVSMGISRKSQPRRLGQARASALRALRGELRGHRHAVDAFGAECVDAQRRCHGGVDPARDADDDLGETVLLDVVAEPEDECETHLLELRLERRHRVGDAVRVLGGRVQLDDLYLRNALARAVELAPPRRHAAVGRSRAVGSMSTTSRCSSKPGARAMTSPASSSTTECPSKTSSS